MKSIALLSVCLCLLSAAALAEESPLQVMSFNIRYGTANDGENDWNHRKVFVVETIEEFNPDIWGTQETLAIQRDYLAERLSAYQVFGVGRDDGNEKGEMMAIYYRKSRFKKLDGGHFWYSKTPNVPGSKSWDSSLPRLASWVKLKDVSNDQHVFFFNTHFDHRGEEARRLSASLLRSKVKEIAGYSPAIITGDFNAPIDSEVYNRLFAEKENSVELIDTFSCLHPELRKNVGTAGGFILKDRGTNRIDWIGCTKQFKIVSAKIDKTNRNGKTPSDHDPVNAVLIIE
ncbi:endonuclease/exonuclease/phosphatase family protein [Planctomicrobium sp.]|nr:endonuclease/exonuclease/phosphatase family protein [Planctomicrobium sp.]MBT5018623.1 endonuclease/exonuclease/phosphatase family protein [Planctomicrobium sp.]MDB4733562.1 endonuclease/exonuclease/phosphatase family protein [Planctomicrobium sp.]MDB4793126.1 endonuclease/exonuclease/phosphatase family protein [bacterium]